MGQVVEESLISILRLFRQRQVAWYFKFFRVYRLVIWLGCRISNIAVISVTCSFKAMLVSLEFRSSRVYSTKFIQPHCLFEVRTTPILANNRRVEAIVFHVLFSLK